MSVQRSIVFLGLFGLMIGAGFVFRSPTPVPAEIELHHEFLLAQLEDKEVDPETFDYKSFEEMEPQEVADQVTIDFLTKLLYGTDSFDVAYADLLAQSLSSDRARREMLFVPARTFEVKDRGGQENFQGIPTVVKDGREVVSSFPSYKSVSAFEQAEFSTTEPGFYISRKAVTNREYRNFLKSTGRPAPAHWDDTKLRSTFKDKPVVNISYDEAEAYARWAGKRLPSLSEIERAIQKNRNLLLGGPLKEWTSTPAKEVRGDPAHQRYNGTPLPDTQTDFYTGFRLAEDEE
ncbi:MAG: SUMF1/EgtB/PvdO family nonheme iron enzyme [Chlamydiia bacterium]|nr:SUMF1/EgtB/PvdO family nonheme iron enzyme [Chlamydiia bacterium]